MQEPWRTTSTPPCPTASATYSPVLGQLPDGFEDQWINAVLRDRQAVKNFSQRVEKTKPPMELRYIRDVADDRGLDWEYTERVLSSRDLDDWMRQGW